MQHKKSPWEMVKMAPVYDFPRAARAEHGHGAKKVLAGVRFQWMLLLLLLPPVHTSTPVLGQQGPTVHAASPH